MEVNNKHGWLKRFLNSFKESKPDKIFCKHCGDEMQPDLPRGSGYRGGCDCRLGPPPTMGD